MVSRSGLTLNEFRNALGLKAQLSNPAEVLGSQAQLEVQLRQGLKITAAAARVTQQIDAGCPNLIRDAKQPT